MVNVENFENIELSKDETEYLKSLGENRYSETDENPKAFSSLKSLGFVGQDKVKYQDESGSWVFKYQAVITETGRRYLLYADKKSKEKAKSSRRYWLTTAVAVVALIKSFLPEISAVAAWLLKLLKPQ